MYNLIISPSVYYQSTAPNFQIMVANGQLGTQTSTVELKFEVGDIFFHGIKIVKEKLTSPLLGLSFLQQNNTILDMRQGVLKFPFSLCSYKRWTTSTPTSWNPIALGRM